MNICNNNDTYVHIHTGMVFNFRAVPIRRDAHQWMDDIDK